MCVAAVRFASNTTAIVVMWLVKKKKLYKKNFKKPLGTFDHSSLCHDQHHYYYVRSAVSGPGQHADRGTLPEQENHLAVPPGARRPRLFSLRRRQPLLLPKNRVLLQLELATHLRPLSSPGSALSTRSARRRGGPLSH